MRISVTILGEKQKLIVNKQGFIGIEASTVHILYTFASKKCDDGFSNTSGSFA